ncbi:MAG: LptA/OstA family protein [Mesorhizobium sp.]|nr:LptA/OstA family protein [Mesorhizobium sp.]
MRPIDRLRCAAVGFALLSTLAPAAAQDSTSSLTGLKLSGDKPIQIESDRLEVRDADSTAVFTGNVSVVQGETLLKSGRMIVYYAKPKEGSKDKSASGGALQPGASSIDRLEVDGKVYVRSSTQVATGDKGTFDMATGTMVLTGKEVVLTEGENVIVGCKLTVTMKTGRAKLDGCGKGTGRVKMLLQPKSQPNSQSQ